MSEETIPGISLNTKGKAILTGVVLLVAVGLAVNSAVTYENNNRTVDTVRPPPTYTGSAPLAITNAREALESNNDFILVFTPCKDEALNASVLNITITAANRIRTVDGIYVGAFTLPQSDSLDYPTVMVRYFIKSAPQYTFRSEFTEDEIFNQYLSYKFMN